jgi:site-specific DNA recombinase
MRRDDYETLRTMGFEDEELKALGLWEPATAPPERLIEAYLRRSKKREDLATMRQHLRDIVRYRWPEGHQIRHVWFEQLSASKHYVRRPKFEEATQAVFDGRSKTLAFWKTDRFDRRGMGAVGRMLDEFDRRRAGLVSTTEGLDSRQPGARIVFAILSERAREEAKDIVLRVNTGHAAHKAEGRRGTGIPPYGLMSPRLDDGKPSGLVAHHPTEYPGARKLADFMLGKYETEDGSPAEPLSATATAKRLNAEGFRTRHGRLFTPESVSRIAQSPLFAGLVPRTERVLDEYGTPTGKWTSTSDPMTDPKGALLRCGEGIVTPGEWFKIKAGFAERTGDGKGRRGASYLLTGIVRCGRCKGGMRHHRGYYRCVNWASKGTCKGGTSTRSPRLEREVSEAWIGHVSALDIEDPALHAIARRWLAFSDPERQAEREHARTALRDAQARVQKLEDDFYVGGRISEERYEQLSAAQRATIETMSARLEELSGEGDLTPLLDSEALREAWADATMADRRALLASVIKAVYVVPSLIGKGDPTPISKRVEYEWVDAA